MARKYHDRKTNTSDRKRTPTCSVSSTRLTPLEPLYQDGSWEALSRITLAAGGAWG